MHLSIALSVALLGQILEVAPGDDPAGIGLVVADSLGEMKAWSARGAIATDAGERVLVGMLAAGTQLEVTGEGRYDRQGKDVAVYFADVLDGPLAGSSVVISKRRTRAAE